MNQTPDRKWERPSPSFQFYPSDWLSSQRVQLFTLEEEGAYIRLLCYCWTHGKIPSDPDKITRIIGKGASTTLATTLSTMFQPHACEDGWLVHERLEQERSKQRAWREKSAEGGRKSAEKRAKSKGGSTTVPRVVGDCLPNGCNQKATLQSSSSPSGISSPEKREKEASEDGLRFAEWFRSTLPDDIKPVSNWKSAWGICYDQLVRIDGRSPDEIRAVCEWARNDEFWSEQFLSLAKLRKKDGSGVNYYDKFKAKMPRSTAVTKKSPTSSVSIRVSSDPILVRAASLFRYNLDQFLDPKEAELWTSSRNRFEILSESDWENLESLYSSRSPEDVKYRGNSLRYLIENLNTALTRARNRKRYQPACDV